MLVGQKWDTAAQMAAHAVGALVADLPTEPLCLNLNVPNRSVEELLGWRRTTLATAAMRSMSRLDLVPKIGHDGAYHVRLNWGEAVTLPEDTDAGAVAAGYVSVTYLSRITPHDPGPFTAPERAFTRLFQ
jgi:broad specificity polyphosphatase/5'/3'-nucleotidase SurE